MGAGHSNYFPFQDHRYGWYALVFKPCVLPPPPPHTRKPPQTPPSSLVRLEVFTPHGQGHVAARPDPPQLPKPLEGRPPTARPQRRLA